MPVSTSKGKPINEKKWNRASTTEKNMTATVEGIKSLSEQ